MSSFDKKSDNPGSSSSFTSTGGAPGSQSDGATASKCLTRSHVKKENDDESTDEHLHRFTVKFSPNDNEEYAIDCDQPRTVLEVIKSEIEDDRMRKFVDENIIIQLGKKDKKYIVATHFPCCCINDGESVIISCESEKVEQIQDQHEETIHSSRDKYSVFCIDTVGGLYTRQKKLFRNGAVKQFKYLCVYGEKGMTVEETLKRDGRFIDDLCDFTLTDNNKAKCIFKCTHKINKLDKGEFKICLPRNKRARNEKEQENPGASNISKRKCDPRPVFDVHKKGVSVKTAMKKTDNSDNTEEISEILRQQFPHLKELMESRFPGNSYQETLEKLRKEDFGKIQQSFSEVHRVRKLLEQGKSVCKVMIQNNFKGTGFVLFDNYILTNAHVFKDCIEGNKLKEGLEVFVLFNYEDPEPHTNYYYFQLAHRDICYSKDELDYAIVELNPVGQKPNQMTQTTSVKVPPGLLKEFSPMPLNGEACIIGHPAGEVKKMDPTCIVEKEKRVQAVKEHLDPYKDRLFTVCSIVHLIQEQGIEKIMIDGEKCTTYHTFMYHGSSGSPVFDANCKVFGLHTGGFVHGFPKHTESVIEFAQPLLTIFEHFVKRLKDNRLEQLLNRVEEVAKGNPHLQQVLERVAGEKAIKGEPADSSELMDFD